MIKNVLRTKVGSSVAIAAAITMASTVGIASAQHSVFKLGDISTVDLSGYNKDQCKNGGWKNFKDANGDPLFKNQGQCVAFFASGGKVHTVSSVQHFWDSFVNLLIGFLNSIFSFFGSLLGLFI
jgi:hypothetical protein